MMKYFNEQIAFQEIPDEISLAINIVNCPHACAGCHSPWLQADIGHRLDREKSAALIKQNLYISCLLFMGGDGRHADLAALVVQLKHDFPWLKFAVYSGDDEIDPQLVAVFDYYKVGSWQAEMGPLNKMTTNQKLYSIKDGVLTDITYKFWNRL